MCIRDRFIIDIIFEQIIDRLLRLAAAAALWDKAWVRGHGHEVEVATEAVECRKQ